MCHKVDSRSLQNCATIKQLALKWSGKVRLQAALDAKEKLKMPCEFCGGQQSTFVRYTRFKALPPIAIIRPIFPPNNTLTCLPVPKVPRETTYTKKASVSSPSHSSSSSSSSSSSPPSSTSSLSSEKWDDELARRDEVGCYTVLDDQLKFVGGVRYELYAAVIQPQNSVAPIAFVRVSRGSIAPSPHRSSTAQLHCTTQHNTAQHSTAQHSTAQHSTAQHSTAQRSSTAELRGMDARKCYCAGASRGLHTSTDAI